jgi:signal transduction histidine kinase
MIAIISGSRISRKFLEPIYLIKENARLIEDGKYKKLFEVRTNTYELHDLSLSVKELAEKLEHQDALRKRMTSDIAHELRTPLATIQSHIEAFMDGVWEPNPEKLTVVHNEISRLTKLIKELSELSVIESDEIKLSKSDINLSALLDNITESFEPLFISKRIQLQKKIQNGISLSGDADRLNQVFANILSNAYKYTNEEGIVRVGLEQSKDLITATVSDTGIGIPKEDVKHIFERFYRSDLSRNRGTGGTGIGLTITKAYVEAHNGRIRIESEEGHGTKIIIEFDKSP